VRLNVVVLTSAPMGVELAGGLALLDEVRSLTVVTTRTVPTRHGMLEKLRRTYRHDGPAGILREAAGRVRRLLGVDRREAWNNVVALRCPGAWHLHCDDLHTPESIALLQSLAPDLGVVFASYRLRPEVFTIPRLGCLNLHLGKAPEFRGSSPGFYEMLEGVPTVGVTVHRISEKLDAGPVLAQESFPLDLAPNEDPITYLRRYQAEVLVSNGIRMMAEAIRQLAHGQIEERAQEAGSTPARRRATYKLKGELRRRVAMRRESTGGARRRD
jgi:folate-dependent phosphoribosylglycinamide formyltransferase PurN